MRPRSILLLIGFPLACFLGAGRLHAQELTLPVYEISILPLYLDSLNADPWSDRTYPAFVEYEEEYYSCRVRYRGATGRDLPKRSWKILFDDEGPLGREQTNLNAEWRDISLCRNYLAMELARSAGLPVPDTRFVSLKVNGSYHGVFVEIEPVDEDFFTRRNLGENGALFKTVRHGARFAPPLHCEDLTWYYEPKEVPPGALDTLGARLAFVQWTSPAEAAGGLGEIVDTENISAYLALQYVISNMDGFTKNQYVHQRYDNRYLFVPWDCDASFGNNWEGNPDPGAAGRIRFQPFDHHALYQRIIEQPALRSGLLDRIDDLIDAGFDSLSARLPAVYDSIRHDVYLDTLKRGDNDQFEQQLTMIDAFLQDRRSALEGLDRFARVPVLEYGATPEYLSSTGEDSVLFRIRVAEVPYSVEAVVIDGDGQLHAWGLFDDGTRGDSLAGDLLYSRRVSLAGLPPDFHYGFLVAAAPGEQYPTPPGGWNNFSQYPLSLPAIRVDSDPPQADDLALGPVFLSADTGGHLVSVVNISPRTLDLGGCILRLGSGHRMLRLDEQEPLSPGDTLFITNHLSWARGLSPTWQVTGCFYFTPDEGDTLHFETSSGRTLVETVVGSPVFLGETDGPVVINEINYHSSDEHDSGDWIELTVVEGEYDLGGWVLRDERDDHSFVIPDGVTLLEGDYLVLAGDIASFSTFFPGIEPVIGNYGFGFGGEDQVRLYDSQGILVDWVDYDDEDPWPASPDGQGPTLELTNPSRHNYGFENWRSSTDPYGTPGERNSVYETAVPDPGYDSPLPGSWRLLSAYPSPFNGSLHLRVRSPHRGVLAVSVYNILGRRVAVLKRNVPGPGTWNLVWDGRSRGAPVSSGVYIVRLESEDAFTAKRVVLLR